MRYIKLITAKHPLKSKRSSAGVCILIRMNPIGFKTA